jgi:hypothetical protein
VSNYRFEHNLQQEFTFMKRRLRIPRVGALCATALLLCTFTAAVRAETIIHQTYTGSFPASISGTLLNQDSVLEETITIPSTSNLTAFTTSYASGGFQPNLTLYNPDGTYEASQWATPPPTATADSSTGQKLDGYLTAMSVSSETYTLTVTDWQLQQSITATNLSDGFTFNLGNGTTFADVTGATRTGQYAVSIDLTATPEPSSLVLAASAFGLLLLARRHLRFINNA